MVQRLFMGAKRTYYPAALLCFALLFWKLYNCFMYEIKKQIYLNLTKNQKSALCNYLRALVKKSMDLSVDEIKGSSRVKELVLPRHIAMYLCKTLTDMNFATIAKVFERDRTTVIHGVDRIMKNIQSDSNLKAEVDFITKDLLPN